MSNKPMKILIVEDDVNDCNNFIESLKGREDFELVGMTDSDVEALKIVRMKHPEGIILDIELNNSSSGNTNSGNTGNGSNGSTNTGNSNINGSSSTGSNNSNSNNSSTNNGSVNNSSTTTNTNTNNTFTTTSKSNKKATRVIPKGKYRYKMYSGKTFLASYTLKNGVLNFHGWKLRNVAQAGFVKSSKNLVVITKSGKAYSYNYNTLNKKALYDFKKYGKAVSFCQDKNGFVTHVVTKKPRRINVKKK